MTSRCLIITLELPHCEMKGQDAERLAGVLVQCPALMHLDLDGNYSHGDEGREEDATLQVRNCIDRKVKGESFVRGLEKT